jgi:ABC-type Mn2+/Zn2+ transport system ATPase subunit
VAERCASGDTSGDAADLLWRNRTAWRRACCAPSALTESSSAGGSVVDDLVQRVETAQLDPEAGALVLAASEGPAAINDLLTSAAPAPRATAPTSPPPPQPSSTATPHPGSLAADVFLQEITVEGFRGIGAEASLRLMPGPGLTLVVGRNGSGKSSFAESLELLLTRSNRRWEKRSSAWKEDWRNVHHTDRTLIRANLTVAAHPGPTVIETSWAPGAGIDDHRTTAQFKGAPREDFAALGWDSALEIYRPILSYNELGSILDDGPSKLFDALSQVLGVEDVVEIAARLDLARKEFTQDEKELKASAAALLAQLSASADPRAEPFAVALRRRGLSGLDTIEALLEGGRTEQDESDTAVSRLYALAALDGPDLDAVGRTAARLRSAARNVTSLDASEAGSARELVGLLEAALAFHTATGERDCPVCSTEGVLDSAWSTVAEARLAVLRVSAASADNAHRELLAARKACEDLAPPPPDALEGTAAREAWSNWHAVRDETDAIRLAEHFEEGAITVAELLGQVRGAAAAELRRLESDWRPLQRAIVGYLGAAREVSARGAMAKHLKRAADWVQATANDMRNERFAPIAAEAKALWAMLRHQSNVDLEEIVLTGKGTTRKVLLDVKVDGVPGAALGVMSQGELHALALSLFLPRATMPESPFRFVVIDDPVQSMDPARVDGLARVLDHVAKSRQVVVFTHDDRLADAVRRLQIGGRVLQVTRGTHSAVEVRAVSDPAERALDDAVALLREGELSDEVRQRVVPGFCRIAVEARCTDIVRRHLLARGKPYAEVEAALLDAERLGAKIGLALCDDAHMRNDEIGHLLTRRFGKRSADAYFDSNRGAHQPLKRPLEEFVEDVKTLVSDLGKVQ